MVNEVMLDSTKMIMPTAQASTSALRRVVMGERAVGHEAKPEELEAMKQLLGGGEPLMGGNSSQVYGSSQV